MLHEIYFSKDIICAKCKYLSKVLNSTQWNNSLTVSFTGKIICLILPILVFKKIAKTVFVNIFAVSKLQSFKNSYISQNVVCLLVQSREIIQCKKTAVLFKSYKRWSIVKVSDSCINNLCFFFPFENTETITATLWIIALFLTTILGKLNSNTLWCKIENCSCSKSKAFWTFFPQQA